MNRADTIRSGHARLSRWHAFIVGLVFTVLAFMNLFPFHYSKKAPCIGEGASSDTRAGRTLGFPFKYYRTVSGGAGSCLELGTSVWSGYDNVFFAQAFFADLLLSGGALIGLNVLLNRRTT